MVVGQGQARAARRQAGHALQAAHGEGRRPALRGRRRARRSACSSPRSGCPAAARLRLVRRRPPTPAGCSSRSIGRRPQARPATAGSTRSAATPAAPARPTRGPFGRGACAPATASLWFWCRQGAGRLPAHAGGDGRTARAARRRRRCRVTVRGYDDHGKGVAAAGATVAPRPRERGHGRRRRRDRCRSGRAGDLRARGRRATAWCRAFPREVRVRMKRRAPRAARRARGPAGRGLRRRVRRSRPASVVARRDARLRRRAAARRGIDERASEGETVMRLLQRNFEVETRYGGGFVQAIEGVGGGREGGRPVDWFYYVNGIEADKGAAERKRRAGDRDLVGPPRLGRGAARAGRRRLVPGAVRVRPRGQAAARCGSCARRRERACDEVADAARRRGRRGDRALGARQSAGRGGAARARRAVGGRSAATRPRASSRAARRRPACSRGPTSAGDAIDAARRRAAASRARSAPAAGWSRRRASRRQQPTWVVTGDRRRRRRGGRRGARRGRAAATASRSPIDDGPRRPAAGRGARTGP